MGRSRRSRLGPRAIAATAALGVVAAGAAVQRRHLRGIAHDEDYQRLRAPLNGRPLRITSADGTELYAEAYGPDDGDTVVLAHGWTEQLAYWGPVINRLRARGLRVVAYDLRGHGRSRPAVEGDYALERFGEDLEAVLAAAGAGADHEPATVAGHSLGAMSIAAWAEHHDPRTRARAAAMVNTGLGDLLSGHLLLPQMARFVNHPWASRAVLGSKAPVPPFSTPLQQAMIRYIAFGPHATKGDVAFYERMLLDTPPDVRAAVGVALSSMDLWHAVASITVPTLVIAGAGDRLTPPAYARRIAEALPDPAGLLELPDTGHMSPLERPREVADALAGLTRDTATAPVVSADGR
ncbi:MAG TPA: alpha/beta fold hydrolase [Solirubrobacteraceae bacterium]|jgi:pimeloyl-ACP methyl ester carboxylesterase|nr:alpha/beta fold hydrolase [Solirubrobacteraceae bacterium]